MIILLYVVVGFVAGMAFVGGLAFSVSMALDLWNFLQEKTDEP